MPGDLRKLFQLLQETDAAELRGDAAAALDVMVEHPIGPDGKPFWRPWRVRYLTQLETLGPLLPGWVTSRWILAQALHSLDPDRRRVMKAIEVAIRVRGVGVESLPGVDRIDAQCRVVDHDWVFRQVHLYELGGLQHFVNRVATPDLLIAADGIRDWARAPMAAYRLLEAPGVTVAWEDLGSGERVDVLNVGSAVLLDPGDCALGRVVPIEGDHRLFETAPLPVPEPLALRVAADPGDWIEAITQARADANSAEIPTSGLHDYGLLTDVPQALWRALARSVGRSSGTPSGQRRHPGADPAAVDLIHAALDGAPDDAPHDGVDPWVCVAAAVVEPGTPAYLASQLTPADGAALARVADRLVEPAADVCRWIAGELRESA